MQVCASSERRSTVQGLRGGEASTCRLARKLISRRSGCRFADKGYAPIKDSRAYFDSAGMKYALVREPPGRLGIMPDVLASGFERRSHSLGDRALVADSRELDQDRQVHAGDH